MNPVSMKALFLRRFAVPALVAGGSLWFALAGPVAAQETNSALTVPAPTPKPAGVPVESHIKSDLGSFDFAEHSATYDGHVRVKDPQLELTCEHLTAKLAPKGGKIESIIAETNVVIDFTTQEGDKVHATAGRAVYTYDEADGKIKSILELMDQPRLQKGNYTAIGDVIIYNRATNKVTGKNITIEGTGEPSIASPPPKK